MNGIETLTTWEGYPGMSTQPIGVEKTGLVHVLHPTTAVTQMITPSVMLANLPTADPHVNGAVWNNAGVPTVSAG